MIKKQGLYQRLGEGIMITTGIKMLALSQISTAKTKTNTNSSTNTNTNINVNMNIRSKYRGEQLPQASAVLY